MQKRFGIAVVTALLASPVAAQAQGIPGGAERGAAEGSAVGGPVGGAVGGAWLVVSRAGSAASWAPIKPLAFTTM
jgi:hypothetical protein